MSDRHEAVPAPGDCHDVPALDDSQGRGPAMTSLVLTPTWIFHKPRLAAKPGLEAAMWRRTAARLRNTLRLDSWRVSLHLAHTLWVTLPPSPCAGPAAGTLRAGPTPSVLHAGQDDACKMCSLEATARACLIQLPPVAARGGEKRCGQESAPMCFHKATTEACSSPSS